MKRRDVIALIPALVLLGGGSPVPSLAAGPSSDFLLRVQALEAVSQGRLGVHILDTATGVEYGHRADERFLMLSSFKTLASALVLHRVDQGLESLERRVSFARDELIPWSPITERHVEQGGLSLAQLCEAAITTSDNTAANLILASYGGPAALTAYLRQLGDPVTRLDRIEPDLNVRHPDAPLDTTSPRAMVKTLRTLLLGDALSARSRYLLARWMIDDTTGLKRLRAGLPGIWKIGEKTGTYKADLNDIGVVWPPGRAPLVVAAYLAESSADLPAREAVIAGIGTLVRDIALGALRAD